MRALRLHMELPKMRRTDAYTGAMPLRTLAVAAGCALAVACGHAPDAGVPGGGDPSAGRELIRFHGCGGCHTVPGVRGAEGLVGPPLTRLGSRRIIAGHLPNTPENLMTWIQRPREIRRDTLMPDTGVSDQEVRHIVAYLYTLR